jgi:hypothetical protein
MDSLVDIEIAFDGNPNVGSALYCALAKIDGGGVKSVKDKYAHEYRKIPLDK